MAGKQVEIHPAALAELKSAVEWYLERSVHTHTVDPPAPCKKTQGAGHPARIEGVIAGISESCERWVGK